ncbi:MAG: leucine-rich repeat protein, partial [Acutalibacteraceae bacterium]|nr:leucine-rich repeat protein [Acutalibacteraceae bacterium]
ILVEPFPGAGQTDFDCILINDDTELRIIGYVGSETSVSIPEQIAGYPVTSIAKGAITNDIVETIHIPATVSEIQAYAFGCVSNFKSITVDSANNNYCSVDGVLFKHDKTELVAYPPAMENVEYVIPDTVLTVAPYAFYKAYNLKNIDLNNVQVIEEYAFDYSALTSVTIPEQVTTLGKSVFYNCANLTEVYFNAINCDSEYSPSIFFNIYKDRHVFADIVTTVELGKNVQYIDSGIFGLVSVTELNIPESVTTIKSYSFKKAVNLTDIYYDGSARMWNEISIGSNSGLTDATIHYGKFTATFISEGETVSQIDYRPGENIVLPENLPEKKYYTFADWTPEVPETMPEYDMEFTAIWKLSDSTRLLEYYVDGEVYFSEYRYEGENVAVPETPSKKGYTFVKWSPDVAENMPNKDLIYEAVWDANIYNVSFMVDGEEYHSYESAYNEIITTPDDPVKEGYTFIGWTPAVSDFVPDYNVTYTAVFEINKYTVNWIADGVEKTETYVFENEITVPVKPQKDGYFFAGWTPTVPSKMPAKNMTFTAKFVDYDVSKIKVMIATPEIRTIQYRNSIVLYASASDLPNGAKIKWATNSDDVLLEVSSDGKRCTVTSVSNGNVVISAYVVDANGKVITNENGVRISDCEGIASEVTFWSMMVYAFKQIFAGYPFLKSIIKDLFY